MTRVYLTEKQVSRDFWYFACSHAVRMSNYIPDCLKRQLTSPFELVHGTKPDPQTWFELFSLGTFPKEKDGSVSRSQHQAHTLSGIAVGRDPSTNAIRFYNPITRKYYTPGTYKLDETTPPATLFSKEILYDGGMVAILLRNKNNPSPEPFPPGIHITLPEN